MKLLGKIALGCGGIIATCVLVEFFSQADGIVDLIVGLLAVVTVIFAIGVGIWKL